MNLLVYTDGSHAAEAAIRFAADHYLPEMDVVLLHVVPSVRQGALQNGERVLERDRQLFVRLVGVEAPVSTRLEVGDAAARISEVASQLHADAIVMGSHGLGAFPRSQVLGRAAEDTVATVDRPVILIFPEGSEVVPAANLGL